MEEIAANLPPDPGPRRLGPGGFGGFVFGKGTEGAIEPLGADRELKDVFLNFDRTIGFIDIPGIGGARFSGIGCACAKALEPSTPNILAA